MDFNYYLKIHKSGNLNEAERGYRKLLKEKKFDSRLFTSLGLICAKTNRENESISFFNKALKINASDLLALNNMGLIHIKKKNFKKAKQHFLKAIKILKHPKTYFLLGQIYTEMNNYQKAIKYYKNSIQLDNNEESLCNLGKLLYITGNLKDAKKFTNQAIKKNSNLAAAHNNLGLIYLAYGEINLAKNSFLKTIKINPKNVKAHQNLSSLIDYKKGSNHKKQLLNLLPFLNDDSEKKYIFFSLGKAFHDTQNYDMAFEYYSKANFIRRKSFQYSINKDLKLFQNIKKTFNNSNFKKYINCGYQDASSIFIVGMPRSGTSLIEQVIATHSAAFGAGEINYLDVIMDKYFLNNRKEFSLKLINKKNLHAAGAEYTKKIKLISSKKNYIINKLPLNFRWIGLIKLILPKAKIIHCKRNALDTCLSIFQQNFLTKGNEFTFNLLEIGKYYNLYLDNILHWKKTLQNDFFEVEYENFITNQKNGTKKLLTFCDLGWEKQCLDFHLTKRYVRTSSDAQVRKKIYFSAVNKWKLYKKHLKELREVLNLK